MPRSRATKARAGRIAFFLPSLRGGGAERTAVNLAQGIAARGVPLDVVLAAAEGPFLGDLPTAARLVDLRAGRVRSSLGPLARYLRRERPKALISMMSHTNLVALWAARLAGQATPVVVNEQNTLSQSMRLNGRFIDHLWPHLLRIFYPRAACIAAVSHGVADDLAVTAGLPRDRIEVVHNSVVTNDLLALARQPPRHAWLRPGQRPVLLGVGRLTAQKDFGTLIRSFAEVRRRRPARLMILGEGEERAALLALARELGLGDDDIALPGFRDNPIAYMAASAVFVLSSVCEGLPTVLIEALAADTRVVSTDCPHGPREILQDGALGTLVPVGDVRALRDAINDVLDQPERALPADAVTPYTVNAGVERYLRLADRGSHQWK